MAHSDKIFMLDKRGRLRALYGNSDKDEKLINDIVKLVEAEI
jgi:cytochrome oxidase Cu insertion factor (SCO1/SenC/PrrC family)